MLAEGRRRDVVNLCQELIRVQSYSGAESAIADKVRLIAIELGYDDVFIDEYGSIVGIIKGRRRGKSILFDGHLDVVPVPDATKWKYGPFSGVIHDGKIFGRGASDMKGALAAMLAAAAFFASDTKRNFKGEICVAGVVQEECFEGIASRQIGEKLRPDYVVIGEASELNLNIGQRGRAEIVIETYGKPAHSANPEAGINAVYKMTKLVEQIRKLRVPQHEILGPGIMELTDIKSSPYPGSSVVPDYCRVTFDRRLLVGEDKKSVLQPVHDLVQEMRSLDPDLDAHANYAIGHETCYTGRPIEGERFFPGWLMETQDEFVQMALRGMKEAGLSPRLSHYSFCTNGSYYAGEAGIKTIGVGPSREDLAHTVDEYIEIEQVLKAVEAYYGILKSVLEPAGDA
ncbi:YgeY family selenium metabolism-linked hydrolase [Acididesulfobacillus acetoxydans]|nr:YgeY family selenium metabolism-linked hydrolase [Acididesulfobacillus acetoxydans]